MPPYFKKNVKPKTLAMIRSNQWVGVLSNPTLKR